MYLPYIRGRQYELLALRELATNNLLGDYVIPIVEPVKLSPTLIKTVFEFINVEHQIAIIINPNVGSFAEDMKKAKPDSKEDSYKKGYQELCDNDAVIKSIIMKDDAYLWLNHWTKNDVLKKDLLVINTERDSLNLFEQEFSVESPCFTVIPDERTFKRRIKRNCVIIDDKFKKQRRNKDYKEAEDKFFSDDHLYYKGEQLKGFSDYSVIGKEYQKSGFAPFAVAIHIVYFDEDKALRIRHFVSDSNDDISNPAKKFYEAVSKLYEWFYDNPFSPTLGLSTLLSHYKNQTYPGLGTVKKLSIMHHLELMGKYLTEVE